MMECRPSNRILPAWMERLHVSSG